MKIGLTYDLAQEYVALGMSEEDVAELDRQDTIDALCEVLRHLGHVAVPIGSILALTQRLARGERWDLVFNIAEGVHGAARESQVPALLDAFQIPYTFSDPLVLGIALNKALAKMVVRAAGIPTPDYRLIEQECDLERLGLAFPIFAKPVAEGTSKGITPGSLTRNAGELRETCCELLRRFRQPVLLETYLPGRELTVGIAGTGADAEVLGSLEVILLADAEAGVYSFRNKKEFERNVQYRLVRAAEDPVVAEAERLALAAWRALGCRDGGRVDLRCDAEGRPSFMEVNPLAGLNPEISDLAILVRQSGLGYRDLIARILASAMRRLPVGVEGVAA